MPIYNRFIGCIKDKVLIMILFFAILSVFQGCSKAQTRSFTYVSLFIFLPSDYSYIKPEILYAIDRGKIVNTKRQYGRELLKVYDNYDKDDITEKVKSFDLSMTFLFIILNVLYYLISEIFFGASIGKYRSNGRLIDSVFLDRISKSTAFKRAVISGLFMLLAVWLRFLFNTNYILIIILYFLIIDTPVFFRRASLIDILTKTSYVEYQARTKSNEKANNEIVVIAEHNCNNQLESSQIVDSTSKRYGYTNQQKVSRTSRISLSPFITQKRKAYIYIYLIWLSFNIIALALGMATPHSSERLIKLRGRVYTSDFFPFESSHLGSYDFSEFIVYTIAIPLCIFATIKLYRLFVPSKTSY